MDVSGNEFENVEIEDDVSGNSFDASYEDQGEPYVTEPTTATLESSVDYSAHFENIETLSKFHIAVTIGLVLCLCFIIGWKHD